MEFCLSTDGGHENKFAAGGNQTLGMVGLENRHGFERVLPVSSHL